MPSPTAGDVHVNRPLTNISVAYMQSADKFVAGKVFPTIPVEKQGDLFFKYDRGSFNRDEMRERAPGTESAGGDYATTQDEYFARVYAFHKDVADQIRANADLPLNMDRDATNFVSQKGLIKRERLFAENYFKASVWGTDITGVSSGPTAGQALQWNDAASTPIEDVAAGVTAMEEETGFTPNTLVLQKRVYDALKNHPDVIDRIKYSGGVSPNSPAIITKEAMAALFEVDRVMVMGGIFNSAAEGVAESSSFIGGKHALLCYSAPAPGLMVPSAGYTFAWTGFMGAGAEGGRIKRFRMENLEADRIELQMAFAQKKIAADLGYFFSGIVA